MHFSHALRLQAALRYTASVEAQDGPGRLAVPLAPAASMITATIPSVVHTLAIPAALPSTGNAVASGGRARLVASPTGHVSIAVITIRNAFNHQTRRRRRRAAAPPAQLRVPRLQRHLHVPPPGVNVVEPDGMARHAVQTTGHVYTEMTITGSVFQRRVVGSHQPPN